MDPAVDGFGTSGLGDTYPYADLIEGDLMMAQSLRAIYDQVGSLVRELQSQVKTNKRVSVKHTKHQMELEAMLATQNMQLQQGELEQDKLRSELQHARFILQEEARNKPPPSPQSPKSQSATNKRNLKATALQGMQRAAPDSRAHHLADSLQGNPSSAAVSPHSIHSASAATPHDSTEDEQEDLSISFESEGESTPPKSSPRSHSIPSAVSSLSPSVPLPTKPTSKAVAEPEPPKAAAAEAPKYSTGGVKGVGKLQVTIRRGRMRESSPAEDLYIKFRYDAVKFRTKEATDHFNPVWNQRFIVAVPLGQQMPPVITIGLHQRNTFSSNAAIGYTKLDLTTLQRGVSIDDWLQFSLDPEIQDTSGTGAYTKMKSVVGKVLVQAIALDFDGGAPTQTTKSQRAVTMV